MYYSGQEIVEIAVRIEENGNAFYNAAAEKLKETNDIKSLFLDLAEKELQHIAVFQKLLEKFEPEDYDIIADDSSGYVSHLAESHIFGKPESGVNLANTVKTSKEALEIAYKFENDSIDFYTELEKRAKTDSKRLIRQIIEEEMEHAADIKKFL
jgi:rubrerythrin